MNFAAVKEVFASALRGVLTAFSHPFLVLYLWLTQLLIAWLAVAPIAHRISEALDHSMLRDSLAQGFDLIRLREFVHHFPAFWEGVAFYQWVLLLTFLGMRFFLSGGLFSALWLGRLSLSQFLYACSSRLPGMLLLLLPTALTFTLLVLLPAWLLAWFVQGLADVGLSVATCFWVFWLGVAFIAVFNLSMVYRIYEYARLVYCAPGSFSGYSKNPLTCYWRAFLFCWRHHFATFALVAGFALMHPLLVWGFDRIQVELLPEENRFWWIFGAGQLVVLARILCSLSAHGAHVAFLRRNGLEKKAATTQTPPTATPADTPKVDWSVGASRDNSATTSQERPNWGAFQDDA